MSKEIQSHEYLEWLLEFFGVDHDGTIADSRTAVSQEFNKIYGTNYSGVDIIRWNTVVDWCLNLGMGVEEAKHVNKRLWYEPETVYKAKPVPGAIEFLYEATARKKDILIISSRNTDLYQSTIDWYRFYAPFIEPEKIMVALPDIEERPMSKAYLINQTRRRSYFEDVPEHAKLVLDYTQAHVFLLSNSSSLKGYDPLRLTQIESENGEAPDFKPINELFFT